MIDHDNVTQAEMSFLQASGVLQQALPPAARPTTPPAKPRRSAARAVPVAPDADGPLQDLWDDLPEAVRFTVQLVMVLLALAVFATVAFAGEDMQAAEAAAAQIDVPEVPMVAAVPAAPLPQASAVAAPAPAQKRVKKPVVPNEAAVHQPTALPVASEPAPASALPQSRASSTATPVNLPSRMPVVVDIQQDPFGAVSGVAIVLFILTMAIVAVRIQRALRAQRVRSASGVHNIMPVQPRRSPPPSALHTIVAACASERGNVRERMEDRVALVSTGQATAAVVCDGLGGYPAGDVAAEAACRAAATYLRDRAQPTISCVQGAFTAAACAVAESARCLNLKGNAAHRTTLLIAIAAGGQLAYGYAGDGVMVHLRGADGVVSRILTPHHDASGMLTASLGPDGIWGAPTFGTLAVRSTDALLLGTDGLERCRQEDLARWLVDMATQAATPALGLGAALRQHSNARTADQQWAVDDNAAVALLLMREGGAS